MNYNVKLLNLIKKRKKYISFDLDIIPQSKKAMKQKGQKDTQKKIIEIMKSRNLNQIKSEVAVEIIVYTNEQNPPRIDNFIKNILDIFHKENLLDNVEDKYFLPFTEDNKINYISTKYIFIKGKSSIFINILPFSSFISDLHFINENIENEEHEHNFHNDYFKELEEIKKNKKWYIDNLSLEAYESLLKLKILDIQKDLTKIMKIDRNVLISCFPPRKRFALQLNEIYQQYAKMLFDFPIRLNLNKILCNKTSSLDFLNEIKEQLYTYNKRNKYLEKPISPVKISVFYSPPFTEKDNFKDIDNIMREYIVPAFCEIFKPPISDMDLLNTTNKKTDLSHIPKSLDKNIIGYEILKIPKKLLNIRKGFLSIGFYIDDYDDESIINKNEEIIDKYIENNTYID